GQHHARAGELADGVLKALELALGALETLHGEDERRLAGEARRLDLAETLQLLLPELGHRGLGAVYGFAGLLEAVDEVLQHRAGDRDARPGQPGERLLEATEAALGALHRLHGEGE